MVSKDHDEDELTQAVNSNPCGICRSMGFPICKGHGGGGGGSEGGSDSGYDAESDDELSDDKVLHATERDVEEALLALGDILLEGGLWALEEGEDDVYTYDLMPGLSITLDMGLGSLVFSKGHNLSDEEQEKIEQLFDAIEQEFQAEVLDKGIEAQASCKREAGSLKIKMPTPSHYYTFVQRLLDKDLLVAQPSQQKDEADVSVAENTQVEQDTYSTTAPTPFNIDKGPKFE